MPAAVIPAPEAIPLNPGQTVQAGAIEHASQYAALGYAPYVLGAWVGLALAWPPLHIFWLCGFLNLVFSIAVGAAILRIMPCWRWQTAYLLLLPTVVRVRAFIMPDALLIEAALLACALALRFASRQAPLSMAHKAGMLALSAAIGALKSSYVLLPLVFLCIPSRVYGGAGQKSTLLAACLALCIAVAAACTPETVTAGDAVISLLHLLSAESLANAQQNLFTFEWLGNLISSYYQWASPPLSWAVLAALMAVQWQLMHAASPGEMSQPWQSTERTAMALVAAGSCALIFFGLHVVQYDMNWLANPEIIRGAVYGRHFYPLSLCLLLALYRRPASPHLPLS
ncbi:MAG: DUF2142 domain-containing protein, partial [Rickettsiales bacterium]|nr:DUF2142 domain-containing protein [Rickettsiales bacterium]